MVRKTWFGTLVFCGLVSGTAAAQPLTVTIGPPAIRWEARPPLILIAPGVWVVEDSPEEVFYWHGWYWTESNGAWYRARDHHAHWRMVREDRVPRRFVAHEPGLYRHYHGEAYRPPPRRMEERRSGHPGRGPERREYRREHPGKEPGRREERHGGHGRGHEKDREGGHGRH